MIIPRINRSILALCVSPTNTTQTRAKQQVRVCFGRRPIALRVLVILMVFAMVWYFPQFLPSGFTLAATISGEFLFQGHRWCTRPQSGWWTIHSQLHYEVATSRVTTGDDAVAFGSRPMNTREKTRMTQQQVLQIILFSATLIMAAERASIASGCWKTARALPPAKTSQRWRYHHPATTVQAAYEGENTNHLNGFRCAVCRDQLVKPAIFDDDHLPLP